MSISPAITFSTIPQASTPETQSLSDAHQPNARKAASPPESGKLSDAEVQAPKDDSASSQLPEDEVQLQHDSQLQAQLIVRYMDKTGNLILQIPSRQTLNLEHAIAAEFEVPKSKASVEEIHAEGESNGH
jgi:hypothetical protein